MPSLAPLISGEGHTAHSTGADLAAVQLQPGALQLPALAELSADVHCCRCSPQDESMFVFVPGPDDPSPGPVLPQAPLPSYFSAQLQEQLPNAVFTSNPCRIRYRAQEIVVFRWGPGARLPACLPACPGPT